MVDWVILSSNCRLDCNVAFEYACMGASQSIAQLCIDKAATILSKNYIEIHNSNDHDFFRWLEKNGVTVCPICLENFSEHD